MHAHQRVPAKRTDVRAEQQMLLQQVRNLDARFFHLSQQKTELSLSHKKQHGFHPDEEILTISKSMCLYLGT